MGRRLPVPLTYAARILEEDTDCEEVMLKKDTLPQRVGEYEVPSLLLGIRRMMMANERDKFNIPRREVQRCCACLTATDL